MFSPRPQVPSGQRAQTKQSLTVMHIPPEAGSEQEIMWSPRQQWAPGIQPDPVSPSSTHSGMPEQSSPQLQTFSPGPHTPSPQ